MSRKSKDNQLPLARIRTIMKTSPNTENVGQDALILMTKCTEMFIQYMASRGLEKSAPGQLDYKGISEFVQSQPKLSFLHEIIPRKMTVAECLRLIKEAEEQERSALEGSSEGESSDE